MKELRYLNSAIDITVDTTGVTVGSVGAAAVAEAGRVVDEPGADDALVAARQRQTYCLRLKTHES